MPSDFPTKSGITRAWLLGSRLRSVQQLGGGIVKDRSVFEDHYAPDQMQELVREFEADAPGMPSSYPDAFFRHFYSPMIPYGPRLALAGGIRGGWQQQMIPPGTYGGAWYKYDITSAYLWAGLEGLPDPTRYRYADRITHLPGLYRCELAPKPGAPFPYNYGGTFLVSPHEIEFYSLEVRRIYWGVLYPDGAYLDPEPFRRAVMRWSFYKAVGRSYWGRWASEMPVTCETWKHGSRNTARELNNPFYNPVWAHLIVSRVRAKLWSATQGRRVARVYVDSIICDTPLETGQNWGDWRLEESYPCGISIAGLNSVRPANAAHAA